MTDKEVIARYSHLARSAMNGERVIDCEPASYIDGQFGAAGYVAIDALPDGALAASLGCGNPVAVADLQPGDTVLDLGSGGGIDVLLSARRVGPSGTVYGLDASPDMLELARRNATEANATNVEFLHGAIEDIPLPDDHVDVVISNCVLCLSSDKTASFAETFRVLKPGGRLGISDIVADPDVDPAVRAEAERAVGTGVDTLTATGYHKVLRASGFTDISIAPTTKHDGGLYSAIIKATAGASPAER